MLKVILPVLVILAIGLVIWVIIALVTHAEQKDKDRYLAKDEAHVLLEKANEIFSVLGPGDSIATSDVITNEHRIAIDNWRAAYKAAKRKNK